MARSSFFVAFWLVARFLTSHIRRSAAAGAMRCKSAPRFLVGCLRAPGVCKVCHQSSSSLGNIGPSSRARLRRGRGQHRCKGQVLHVRVALTFFVGRAPTHLSNRMCSGWRCLLSIPVRPPQLNSTLLPGGIRRASRHLLAELYAAMPSLAACGFRASFGKQLQATSALMRQASSSRRAASAAAAAPTLGVDMQALQALVAKAREALAEISA